MSGKPRWMWMRRKGTTLQMWMLGWLMRMVRLTTAHVSRRCLMIWGLKVSTTVAKVSMHIHPAAFTYWHTAGDNTTLAVDVAWTGPVSAHQDKTMLKREVLILTSTFSKRRSGIQDTQISFKNSSTMSSIISGPALSYNLWDMFQEEIEESHGVDANLGEDVRLSWCGKEKKHWSVWNQILLPNEICISGERFSFRGSIGQNIPTGLDEVTKQKMIEDLCERSHPVNSVRGKHLMSL